MQMMVDNEEEEEEEEEGMELPQCPVSVSVRSGVTVSESSKTVQCSGQQNQIRDRVRAPVIAPNPSAAPQSSAVVLLLLLLLVVVLTEYCKEQAAGLGMIAGQLGGGDRGHPHPRSPLGSGLHDPVPEC
ncbi:hypothetical protein LIA77_08484 [Sarocladium implicatum]|nr:hypothetical protein LIA77_08484 [Sarocladium implicatum]